MIAFLSIIIAKVIRLSLGAALKFPWQVNIKSARGAPVERENNYELEIFKNSFFF